MSSNEEDQPLGDLPIVVNDLKVFKYENNVEEAVDAILFYTNSDNAR